MLYTNNKMKFPIFHEEVQKDITIILFSQRIFTV